MCSSLARSCAECCELAIISMVHAQATWMKLADSDCQVATIACVQCCHKLVVLLNDSAGHAVHAQQSSLNEAAASRCCADHGMIDVAQLQPHHPAHQVLFISRLAASDQPTRAAKRRSGNMQVQLLVAKCSLAQRGRPLHRRTSLRAQPRLGPMQHSSQQQGAAAVAREMWG